MNHYFIPTGILIMLTGISEFLPSGGYPHWNFRQESGNSPVRPPMLSFLRRMPGTHAGSGGYNKTALPLGQHERAHGMQILQKYKAVKSKIRNRILAIFLIAAVVPILTIGCISIVRLRSQMQDHYDKQLSAEAIRANSVLFDITTSIYTASKMEERLVNVIGGVIIETESERLMKQGEAKMLIKLGQKGGLSDAAILDSLQEEMGVSSEKAKAYLEQFGKQLYHV